LFSSRLDLVTLSRRSVSPGIGAVAGAVVVLGNVAAVVVLSSGVGSAYRVDELDTWISQARTSPLASDLAALLFIIGCAAFVPWGFAVARSLGGGVQARWGAGLVAFAAALNVVGVPFTIVSTRAVLPGCADAQCLERAGWWLRRATDLDAAFNAALGAGLIVFGLAAARARPGRALAVATIVAGAAALPVSLQSFSALAARWLAVAGPAWLLVVAAWSLVLWRSRA
jgi:hypothetical protein